MFTVPGRWQACNLPLQCVIIWPPEGTRTYTRTRRSSLAVALEGLSPALTNWKEKKARDTGDQDSFLQAKCGVSVNENRSVYFKLWLYVWLKESKWERKLTNLSVCFMLESRCQLREEGKMFLGILGRMEETCDTRVCVCFSDHRIIKWELRPYWLPSLLCNSGMLELNHHTKPQKCCDCA